MNLQLLSPHKFPFLTPKYQKNLPDIAFSCIKMSRSQPLGSPNKLLQESKEENERILSTSSPAPETGEIEHDDETDKNDANHLLSPSKSTRLTLGSRVMILGTDNVEHRVPQYVGVEAEIVVVPGE